MQNPPRPLDLGRLIKSLRDLITTVPRNAKGISGIEVILDFILHNLVHNVIDGIAALIEKSRIN